MTAEQVELFNSLPPELQTWLFKRYEEVETRGIPSVVSSVISIFGEGCTFNESIRLPNGGTLQLGDSYCNKNGLKDSSRYRLRITNAEDSRTLTIESGKKNLLVYGFDPTKPFGEIDLTADNIPAQLFECVESVFESGDDKIRYFGY